jgi:L-serine kinase (ADP)
MVDPVIELVNVDSLRHIEGFSRRRVEWLKGKILKEAIWIKPIAIDDCHSLVLDGQHRMEVALALELKKVPAVKYDYSTVTVWSLRKNYVFDWKLVTERALIGDIYPYKTVKHRFPEAVPLCHYLIEELKG